MSACDYLAWLNTMGQKMAYDGRPDHAAVSGDVDFVHEGERSGGFFVRSYWVRKVAGLKV